MRKQAFFYFFYALLSIQFSTNILYAAPEIQAISGELVSGQNVIILGTNFGKKIQAAPLLWDNFDSGTISTGWTQVGDLWKVYSGTEQITNSKYCLRADRSLAASIPLLLEHEIQNSLYVFVKRRWDFELLTRNQKFFRVWQSSGIENLVWAYNDGNKYHMRSDGTAPSIAPGTEPPAFIVYPSYPVIKKWQTEEFFIRLESAPGAIDGTMAFRKNNNVHRSWAKNRGTIGTGVNYPYSKIYIDNYGECEGGGHECLTSGSYIWVDDVYIDNTWARVMIGDNANYDNCTKIEVQPPVSWDDTKGEIIVTLNRGEFDTLEGKYLFVIDADNNTSAGFLLGGTAPTPIKPSPPQGLKKDG